MRYGMFGFLSQDNAIDVLVLVTFSSSVICFSEVFTFYIFHAIAHATCLYSWERQKIKESYTDAACL